MVPWHFSCKRPSGFVTLPHLEHQQQGALERVEVVVAEDVEDRPAVPPAPGRDAFEIVDRHGRGEAQDFAAPDRPARRKIPLWDQNDAR